MSWIKWPPSILPNLVQTWSIFIKLQAVKQTVLVFWTTLYSYVTQIYQLQIIYRPRHFWVWKSLPSCSQLPSISPAAYATDQFVGSSPFQTRTWLDQSLPLSLFCFDQPCTQITAKSSLLRKIVNVISISIISNSRRPKRAPHYLITRSSESYVELPVERGRNRKIPSPLSPFLSFLPFSSSPSHSLSLMATGAAFSVAIWCSMVLALWVRYQAAQFWTRCCLVAKP